MVNTHWLGGKIRALRKKQGLTQEDLAIAVEVTPQAVSKWERGLSFPEIAHLPRLADCFGCSVDALLRDPQKNDEAVEPTAGSCDAEGVSFIGNELPESSEALRDAAVQAQCTYLQGLCNECVREADCEFELGRYDRALLAYTRGLRSLESFLILGEEGINAYPWAFLLPLHWMLYLRRAACYQCLMRSEDSLREIASAKEIVAWLGEDAERAIEEELYRLGLKY